MAEVVLLYSVSKVKNNMELNRAAPSKQGKRKQHKETFKNNTNNTKNTAMDDSTHASYRLLLCLWFN